MTQTFAKAGGSSNQQPPRGYTVKRVDDRGWNGWEAIAPSGKVVGMKPTKISAICRCHRHKAGVDW